MTTTSDEMLARAEQQILELSALSVKNILIGIVPGDGSAREIYAQSVDDIRRLLTELDSKLENAQSECQTWRDRSQAQKTVVPMTMEDIVAAAGAQHIDVYAASFMCGIRSAEAHYGVTTKAVKKEPTTAGNDGMLD